MEQKDHGKMPKVVAAAAQVEVLKKTNSLIFVGTFFFIMIMLLSFAFYVKGFSAIATALGMHQWWKQKKEIERIRLKYEL